MGHVAAKFGDEIVATDTHIVLLQPPPPGRTTQLKYAFRGPISGAVSANVFFEGKAAATVGSTAISKPHIPARSVVPHSPIAIAFVMPPTHLGVVSSGSDTVRVNGKPVARNKDRAQTCNDPEGMKEVGTVEASSSVRIG
jgi:uncharacterized Zn-binding protein involved in type VI secretion